MERKKGFVKPLSHKSYLSLLYWLGIRKAEALERIKEDFQVQDGILIITAPAKKGGERLPLEIPIDLPYVDLILQQINRTKKGRRVWTFESWTAWKIVKRVMPKHYPHFFRLNRATRFLDDPTTTIPEMKAWFGWKRADSLDPYIGISKRGIAKQRGRLRSEISEEPAQASDE